MLRQTSLTGAGLNWSKTFVQIINSTYVFILRGNDRFTEKHSHPHTRDCECEVVRIEILSLLTGLLGVGN